MSPIQGLNGTANFHHQIALAFLVTNLNIHFNKSKKALIATAETRIDYLLKKTKKYTVPDVIVWDYKTPKNSVFWLENTTTKGLKKNIDKTSKAFDYLPNLNEAFVFDYQAGVFYKLTRNFKKPIKSSKSTKLKLDLTQLIGGVVC